MARPRVFVSSTFYDLRVIRADLERFMKEMGYEPVLFERGHVPYGREEALEEYCYREVSSCEMLVAVIGGKYGSQAKGDERSITQKELRAAIDAGKQTYVFIEQAVLSEYRTYIANRDLDGFQAVSVDDTRVFLFIEEVYGLSSGNPVEGFETSNDIVRFLKEQWAGLFQRLLNDAARQKEVNIIENLKETASTLNALVTYLTEERSKGDQAIKDILLSSHPAFAALKEAAKIPYRVIFYNFGELDALLSARGFKRDDNPFLEGHDDWDDNKAGYGIRVVNEIFDDEGQLKVFTPEQWQSGWISRYTLRKQSSADDDEIPF